MWRGRAKRDRKFWARDCVAMASAVLNFAGAFPFEVPSGEAVPAAKWRWEATMQSAGRT